MTSSQRHPIQLAAAAAALALLAACASSPRMATRPPTLLIRIEHRADPGTPLTLWAVPAKGERLRLGLLTDASPNLVRFDRVDPALQYRFVAQRGDVTTVSSPPFTPGSVDVVAWDMTANTLTPVETRQ